ncbi:HNH endonuclease [Methylomonas sp. MED-D]
MDCRNARAKLRAQRIKENGGSHTKREWSALLARSPTCAECDREWSAIPPRPDSRYKNVWTKGHKHAVYHGGTDDISNIQAECYECNFKKNAGRLKRT